MFRLTAGKIHLLYTRTREYVKQRHHGDEGRLYGSWTFFIAGLGRCSGSTVPGRDVRKELRGNLTPDGHLILGADEKGCQSFASVDNDSFDHCYAEAGPSARSVCARLLRRK